VGPSSQTWGVACGGRSPAVEPRSQTPPKFPNLLIFRVQRKDGRSVNVVQTKRMRCCSLMLHYSKRHQQIFMQVSSNGKCASWRGQTWGSTAQIESSRTAGDCTAGLVLNVTVEMDGSCLLSPEAAERVAHCSPKTNSIGHSLLLGPVQSVSALAWQLPKLYPP